jgi:uncharacterized protein YciI
VYFLVILTDAGLPHRSMPDHEPFIDSLIGDHRVLQGGPLRTSSESTLMAAYVLRCETLADAQQLVATDPMVADGVAKATVTHWDLVALDLGAIESGLVVLQSPRLAGQG